MGFKGFSVAKYYLRLESAPLNPQIFCKKTGTKKKTSFGKMNY